VLIFVGVKMMISHWFHVPTFLSLVVIVATLVGAIVFSLRKTKRELASGDDLKTQ
jgi:predicted tellurium resistance membrane protein TerC